MKFFSIVLFLAFCGCYCDYTQQQEENAKKTADGRAFYERGKGTPAEYITNQRGMLNGEGKILRGESNGDYSRAVRLLSQLYEDAERGFCWKEPPASVNVPRTEGGFLKNNWEQAYCWQKEFLLDSSIPLADSRIKWRVGYDRDYFYCEVIVPDSDIRNIENSPREDRWMWQGDSLEVFIRPEETDTIYFEFIVNPAGEIWGLKHAANVWGKYITLNRDLKIDVRVKTFCTTDDYQIQIAIPLRSLHGNWCMRSPQPGDCFSFMLVRTNLNDVIHTRTTPVPFLYDGHNIYGYIRATLAE